MRNRPDANRWRVTMNDTCVEVFRRPVLTSEVTLGALGIGNAPLPVPICVCSAHITDTDASHTVIIYNQTHELVTRTTTHNAIIHMLRLTHEFDDMH